MIKPTNKGAFGMTSPIHYAWIVIVIAAVMHMAGGSIRQAFGVLGGSCGVRWVTLGALLEVCWVRNKCFFVKCCFFLQRICTFFVRKFGGETCGKVKYFCGQLELCLIFGSLFFGVFCFLRRCQRPRCPSISAVRHFSLCSKSGILRPDCNIFVRI